MTEKDWMTLIYLLSRFMDLQGRAGKVISSGITRMVRNWARGEYYKMRGTSALEKEGAIDHTLPGAPLLRDQLIGAKCGQAGCQCANVTRKSEGHYHMGTHPMSETTCDFHDCWCHTEKCKSRATRDGEDCDCFFPNVEPIGDVPKGAA